MRSRTIRLESGADLAGFRATVRHLVPAGIPPEAVTWLEGEAASLFAVGDSLEPGPALALPRAAAALIPPVVMHRDPERYALLYQLVWRVAQGERHLAEVASDPLVHRLGLMQKSVARDLHKMHAFLRFRRAGTGAGAGEGDAGRERFAAWFEPEHHILAEAAPFFSARFPSFDWSILTPEGSAHWDGRALTFGPPGRREDVPEQDAFEAGWTDYYSSTFNPARTNLAAMRAEMPKKYWHNMPETAAIAGLVREAGRRTSEMIARAPEAPVKRVPARALAAMAAQEPASLEALNAVIRASEPLVPGATQAVLGEGPIGAEIAFVGEQPGDQEDVQGRPFVGPAGQLLSRALREAGIDRERTYLTNAVKHFKFEVRGKRRIHQKPGAGEVAHYRWWLERELAFVAPRLVVALGATAVLALSGRPVPITRVRGPASFGDTPYRGFVTVHPAYLLRLPDEAKGEAYAEFVADLRRAAALVTELRAA